MKVYHYRSTEVARLEIDKGTFHFSSTNELNDPLEGVINVYWKASKLEWEGLFCTYGFSLLKSLFNYYLVLHVDRNNNDNANHILKCNDSWIFFQSHCGFKNVLDSLYTEITNLPIVQSILEYCCSKQKNQKITKNTLIVFLYYAHLDIFKLCIQKMQTLEILKQDAEKIIRRIDKKLSISEDAIKDFKDFFLHQDDLTDYCNKTRNDCLKIGIKQDLKELIVKDLDLDTFNKRKHWFDLETDFPQVFVEEISKLIFHQSYVTCFSLNCNNSALWGNYADSHRGVCLIYEFLEEAPILKNTELENKISKKKVEYTDTPLECNFFESFYNVENIDKLVWLPKLNEITSKRNQNIIIKQSIISAYHGICKNKEFRKFKDWSYEQEYRISLPNSELTSIKNSKRNLEFNPNLLKGVIFGINTSNSDKIDILRLLKKYLEQLPDDRKKDLKIYQAYYDEVTNSIDKLEINYGDLLE